MPAGTVAVVVIGGAVVEDSVVVVVGGTPEEQALKPIDAIIARAKAPFFTSFMMDASRFFISFAVNQRFAIEVMKVRKQCALRHYRAVRRQDQEPVL